MIRALAAVLVLVAAGSMCQGAEPDRETYSKGAFEKFLVDGAPECVPLKGLTSIGTVAKIDLNERQFEFIRALFVALPPVSQKLPPGDKAMLFGDASSNAVMAGLIDDGKVCARFLLPRSIQKMIQQVGEGKTFHSGEGL